MLTTSVEPTGSGAPAPSSDATFIAAEQEPAEVVAGMLVNASDLPVGATTVSFCVTVGKVLLVAVSALAPRLLLLKYAETLGLSALSAKEALVVEQIASVK